MSKIPLSWSRVSVYRQCPRQFEAKYIDKQYTEDPTNPAFIRGNEVHKQLEEYINERKGARKKVSLGIIAKNAKHLIDSLFKKFLPEQIHAEKQLALGHEYKPCDWFDNTDTVKWRAIIDMLVEVRKDRLIVNDFKTGKVRDYSDNMGQLHLTAMLLFELYPEVNTITCSYLFVEHKESIVNTFNRKDHAKAKAAFDLEWLTINEDKDFEAKKNKYCFSCQIKKECEFG